MSFALAVTIAEKGMSFDIVRESRLFPTMEILNSFFECGIDDVDSGIALHWKPFLLTPVEYDQFLETCQASIGALEVDALGFECFDDWFSVVAVRSKGN